MVNQKEIDKQMSATLTISEIKQQNNQTILTQIAEIQNYDTIEKLQEIGRHNWYLGGECGAIFELQGYELNECKELLEFECNTLINYQFDNDDWYECRLSF